MSTIDLLIEVGCPFNEDLLQRIVLESSATREEIIFSDYLLWTRPTIDISGMTSVKIRQLARKEAKNRLQAGIPLRTHPAVLRGFV